MSRLLRITRRQSGSVVGLIALLFLSVLVADAGAYSRPVKITRVNLTQGGTVPTALGDDQHGVVSMDDRGRFVAFDTAASLVPLDVNGMSDIYVRDTVTDGLELITKGMDGTPAAGPPLHGVGIGVLSVTDLSLDPHMSGNSRFVVFVSSAANLVSDDFNPSPAGDVFIHDRRTHITELASLDSNGRQSLTAGRSNTPDSFSPSVSDDGRFVVFGSRSDGLVPGDTNGVADIFVRDMKTGKTDRVSVDSAGSESDGCSVGLGPAASQTITGCSDYGTFFSSVSGDGRHVVFEGWASDFVERDVNNSPDVFIHDRQTGKTKLASLASDGSQGADPGSPPTDNQSGSRLTCCGTVPSGGFGVAHSISDDGRYVLFLSAANNLVPSDSNGREDLLWDTCMDFFVRDMKLGRTERVTVDSVGHETTRCGNGDIPSISGNGRFVTYFDRPDNHVDQEYGSEQHAQVYVHDRLTGATELASRSADGSPQNGSGLHADIGADGRFVSFWSGATNLTEMSDENQQRDLFLADRGQPLWSGLGARGINDGASSGSARTNELLATAIDPHFDSTDALEDAEVISALAVSRSSLSDLFLRIDLERLSLLRTSGSTEISDLRAPLLTYGFEIETTRGDTLQARALLPAGSTLVTDPAFGLYRCDAASCTKVADLEGSYGSVGETIEISVPMSLLGSSDMDFTRIDAFSASTIETSGALRILDTVALLANS